MRMRLILPSFILAVFGCTKPARRTAQNKTNDIMRRAIIPLIFVFSGSANAEDLNRLMRSAAANGSAEGEVTGQVAQFWRETTKSNAPIFAKITTVKHFKRDDCRRLNVETWQDRVPTKQGELVLFKQSFQLNLCSDGTPPDESVAEWKAKEAATGAK